MNSDKLKILLEKAINDGIIERCDGIENLKCPYVDRELFHGWCDYRKNRNINCARGANRDCFHRLDIFYDGGPMDGVMLIVRYRYSPNERIGFIPNSDEQLGKILREIESARR